MTENDDNQDRDEALARLLDSLPLMAGVAREDGRVIHTNRAWHAFVETPRAGEPGHVEAAFKWRDCCHQEDLPELEAAFARARRDVAAFDFRWRLRNAAGQWRWCTGRVTPDVDARGRVTHWVWVLWDDHPRIEAEIASEEVRAALAAAQQRLEVALDAAHIGFWDCDLGTGAVSWNGQLRALLGCLEPDVPASTQAFFERVLDIDRERVQAAFDDSCRTGSQYDSEFRIRWPDGSVRWLVGRGQALLDDTGRPVRIMGVNYDVTEAREAQRLLERDNATKDEFLAMLGHELRNPLAPVANAIEILERAGGRDEVRHKTLAMMRRQLRHLTRLVDDLLETSRIRQGRITLRKERIAVCDAVHAAVESLRPQIEARGHRLDLKLLPADQACLVLADPTRLSQIVTNLLANAAKYTPPGGHLRVEVDTEDGWARVRVQDNGMGIHPELLPRVFDLFTQAQRTLERAEGGLGIGLALVKRLVELHGGAVSAFSDGPGQGACFQVKLPIVAQASDPGAADDGEEPPAIEGEASTKVTSSQARHVVFWGTAPHWGESLAALLRLDGHEASVVHDERALLDLAALRHADCVVMDVGNPAHVDPQRLAFLRSHRGLGHAAWLAVSNYGRAEDRRAATDRGFARLLTHPVTHTELSRVLRAR